MFYKSRSFKLVAIILTLAITLVGCNAGTDEDKGDAEAKGTVKIGLNNWAENIAVSNMWKVLLEEKGYEVELKTMDKAPIWVAIAQGDLDFAPEVWLPTTDEPLYEEYKEDIVLGDPWYNGTGLGLVVPEYVDINSIEDLNGIKDQFEGRIVGIDPGSSLARLTDQVIQEYGLDYEHVTSSGPAMMSELSKAYGQEEPIVVTLWNPHWAFADYDLKYLEDPKNIYGDEEDIYYMNRQGFDKDFPELVTWLNNWQMDDASLGNLMSIIKDKGDAEDGAKEWIEANRDLVDSWMK